MRSGTLLVLDARGRFGFGLAQNTDSRTGDGSASVTTRDLSERRPDDYAGTSGV